MYTAINVYLYLIHREWFRKSCLSSKQVSSSDDAIPKSLLELLKKQESILIIASRYVVTTYSRPLVISNHLCTFQKHLDN